jgi:hypothetical protein
MAMNVSFKKGLKASLPSTRDANTFYYVSDEFALYLGEHLISNEVTLEQFNALEERVRVLEGKVKTLEDWKVAIDEWKNSLPEYVTKAVYDAFVEAQDLRDDGQDELIAGLRKDLDDITEVGGEPNKVDDVKVNGVSVVTDKIANIDISGKLDVATYNEDKAAQSEKDAAQDKALTDYKAEMVTAMSNADTAAQGYAATAEANAKEHANKAIDDLIKTYLDGETDEVINTLEEVAAWINNDTAGVTKIIEDVATNKANIKTINESAVMTSGITAAKVGDYDTIKSTVDTNKPIWDGVVNKLDASTYNTFVGTTYATLDAAVAAANSHADSKDADIAKGVDAQGRVATLEGKVDVEKVSTAIATATADMATNASVDEKLAGYAKTADLGTASAKNVEFFATAAQGEAGVAAKAVTDTLKSAAFVETSAFDAAGAAAAVQGETTNTVKDCVDAINTMNGQVGSTIGTVENIVNQLTWGSF